MSQPKEITAPAAIRRRRLILAAAGMAAAGAVGLCALYVGFSGEHAYYTAWRNGAGPKPTAPAVREDASALPTADPKMEPGRGSRALPGSQVPTPPELPPLTDAQLTVNDRPLIAPPTGVPTDTMRQAIDAYRTGKLADGDAVAHTFTDPAARALLEWMAIRYNGSSLPFARINAFMKAYPDWPAGNLAQRQAEYALMRQKADFDTIIAFFNGKEPQTPHGVMLLADAREAKGDAATATRLIVDMWRNDALSAPLEKRIIENYANKLPQAEHRNRMEHFLLRENWATALRAANLAGPDHVKLARARMAVATPKLPGKAAETALGAVPAALRKDNSWLFSKALFLRKTADNEAARAIHMAVPQSALAVDGGDEWWIERRILARRYLDAGDPHIAYDLVRHHGAERDALKIEAEFHAGWIALRYLHKPDVALSHFEAASKVAVTPVSVARTAYWRGRAKEVLQRADDARIDFVSAAQHGTTYYGQLARIKLSEPTLQMTPAPAPPPDVIDSLPVRSIRLLQEADRDALATPLFLGIAREASDAGAVDMVARLAASRNDARTMVNIGKAAMQRGLDVADLAWPVQGVPQFAQTGRNVEHAMVLAISRQESVFDPTAMSPAGARGLMQLMPATAQRTAARAGKDFDLGRLTSDPAYNATLGAHHLGDLLDDWRGSYILAFAAYNAGGGNVKKWLATNGDPRDPAVDPVDWVELIPFSETRNYVQRVMENLQVYRQRLQPGTPLLMADDMRRGVLANDAAKMTAPSRQAVAADHAPPLADMNETTSSITTD